MQDFIHACKFSIETREVILGAYNVPYVRLQSNYQ